MKEQLQMLWELQGLEQRMKSAAHRQEAVNSEEVRKLWQDIQQFSRTMAADKKNLESKQLLCERQEEKLSSLSAQLKVSEKRLYSGELTHTKEMEQLKTKCEELQRDITLQETALLSTMEECEKLSGQITAYERQTAEAKKMHQKKQQDMAAQARHTNEELAAVEADYKLLTQQINTEILAVYQRLKTKYAAPVSRLENGVCSGCRMSIPTRQSVSMDTIVCCDNCGRILL